MLDTTKTLVEVTYNGEAYTLDDGKDMLQARVDGDNSCKNIFYEYGGTELDVSRLNTSNATDMTNMFCACKKITSLNLSHFNTSKVTKMAYTFSNCQNLTTLDLSSWDTSNVTNMNSMFYYLRGLRSLKLGNFNTSNVTTMHYLFGWCSNLKTIPCVLDLYSATNVGSMFDQTTFLEGVTLKNIRTSLQIGSGTLYGHLWELPYLINAVKECWENPDDQNPNTLTIGGANLEKIANVYVKLMTPTAEQVEADPYINFKLPCEVCESTDEGAMTLTAYAALKNWTLA